MFSAVIFDMDGIIIDSEPLWRQSMIKVFADYGLKIDEEQCMTTKGMKIDDVIRKWNLEKNLEWDSKIHEIKQHIHTDLIHRIKEFGMPIDGTYELLDFIRKKLKLKTGLATSSDAELMYAVMDKLNLHPFMDVVIHPTHNIRPKPEPDLYLHCAIKLKVSPSACLAIEDSYFGILSAKKAGMKVIGIPESNKEKEKFIPIADYILKSHREVKLLLENIFEKFIFS